MPNVPAQSVRLVLKGTGIGSEIWQTGAWFNSSAVTISSQANLQALVSACMTRSGTLWTAIKPKIYSTFSWTGLALYYYDGGPTARYVAQGTTSPTPGTQTTNGPDVMTSCVVQLRTDISGKSYRGRMYVPRHEPVLLNTGLFSTVTSDYANAFAAWLQGIETDTLLDPSVVSATAGVKTPITSTACNQLPHVQRRRENRMGGGTVSTHVV